MCLFVLQNNPVQNHYDPPVGEFGDRVGRTPEIEIPQFQPEVWDKDADLIRYRQHFHVTARATWQKAMDAFISGDWLVSRSLVLEVMSILDVEDGPSKFILDQMSMSMFVAPLGWQGFRDTD